MTQENKQLLLRDLCARLSYGVILSVGIFDNGDMKYHNKKLDCHSNLLSVIELDGGYYFNGLLCRYPQFTAKPYLRSLTSMTKDEIKEYLHIKYQKILNKREYRRLDFKDYDITNVGITPIDELLDWLNAHHFDYRGLIEKGLAIEVTPENNPYK